MADNFTELKKNLSNAEGTVSVDGTRMGFRFYAVPTSLSIASAGFISIEEAKSGKAKADLIKQAKNSIRSTTNTIQARKDQIAKEQAIINDPNSTPIQKKGAERRLAEEQTEIAREEKELGGAQSVLAYAEGGFQSDLDSLTSKAEAEQKKLEAQVAAQQTPPPAEPTTSGTGQPAPTTDSKTKADNVKNDDATPTNVPGQNQNPPVVPSTKNPATVSSTGSGQGSQASPSASGTQGKNTLPGRRLYNPLSQLASYTYNLTLYMITPDAYDAFISSGRKKIDALAQATGLNASGAGTSRGGAFVIAQSGGVNNKTQNRAPGFELDYYIDNFKFVTPTSGKQTGTVASYGMMSFTITEPYGFSFLTNLRRAREALAEYSNQTTYKECLNNFAQFFIMGIKFYGYDINGNLIKGGDTISDQAIDPLSSGEALFENFYDIGLQDLKFQVNGKTTQYAVTATSLGGQAALGTKRGRLITGAKLRGSTVHEMLIGPNGLFTKLNKEQQDKVNKNPQDQMFANEYDVVYLDDAYDAIGVQSMVLASDLNKWRWPGSSANTTAEATDAVGIKEVPDSTQRELVFNNDTSILQAITQIVQKSRYMENALKTIYNNVVQPNPEQKGYEQTQKNNVANISWFQVSVELSNPRWDPIVSDWAYKQTYIIQKYEVPAINSAYSNQGQGYYGPHKRYNYLLTGQNSEVLDFVLNFNFGYQNVVLTTPSTNQPTTGAQTTKQPTSGSTAGGIIPVQSGAKQNADSTGSLNNSAEAQNSIVTDLTDPLAYCNCKIKILGDPDFLVRDQSSSLSEVYNKFYGSDGFTVSANGGQVFIEIVINEGIDYSNDTGLFKINEEILFMKYSEKVKKIAKGIIFQVNEVQSSFSNGRFEQDLVLVMTTAFGEDSTSTTSPEKDAAARENNTNQPPQTTTSGNRDSGGSVGNSQATVGNTGQKTEPPKSNTPVASPSVSPASTNTVGTPTTTPVNTRNGPVADDDSTGSSAGNTKKVIQEGREPNNLASKTDGELFALGYTPDEIQVIRSGGRI